MALPAAPEEDNVSAIPAHSIPWWLAEITGVSNVLTTNPEDKVSDPLAVLTITGPEVPLPNKTTICVLELETICSTCVPPNVTTVGLLSPVPEIVISEPAQALLALKPVITGATCAIAVQ